MNEVRPHYPWKEGDHLFAAELNAAIANITSMGGPSGPANVLDYGADPTGVEDSSGAINCAASSLAPNGRHRSVYLPPGTYRICCSIALSDGQAMYGESRGNTILVVSDDFDPTAVAVITLDQNPITASPQSDPGPLIRDLYIRFIQPQTQNSRANFKTLAEGGTSVPGGTGVKYPWAIATVGQCRPQIVRVRIGGAWDGITTNGVNAMYWLDDIEMGALDCGLSLGEGPGGGIFDWCHISGYHFWPFDLDIDPILSGVFSDWTTIAMRVGGQNGLEGRGIVSYNGRVVFTEEAINCWADIVNLDLDNDGATLEIATCRFIHITNFYAVADNNPTRGTVMVGGGIVNFSNWYSQNYYKFHLVVTGGDVSVIGGYMSAYSNTMGMVQVEDGRLRMQGIRVNPVVPGAWELALISQYSPGVLQVTDIDVSGDSGSSGIAIVFNGDETGNSLGPVSLAAGWAARWPYGPLGYYGDVQVSPNDSTSMQSGSTVFSQFNSAGHFSTGYGYLALNQHSDSAIQNTAFGSLAGYGVTGSSGNSFFGTTAGYSPVGVITGDNNSAFGAEALYHLTSGDSNSAFGQFAGYTLTTGSNNLLLGHGADVPTPTTNDYINIANVITVTGAGVPNTSLSRVAGRLAVLGLPVSVSYANDAAAAAGGVIVGGLYRSGSAVQVRVT